MTERRRLWLWGLVAAALTVLVRLPSLNLFLDRDEGEYASLAWLWRSGAGLPYRDWVEQKPPLATLMNLAAQRGWDDGVLGLRVLSLAWILATVLGIYALVLGMAGRGRLGWRLRREAGLRIDTAGLAAALAALLLSSSRTQSLAANTETWQSLPLLGALALLFLPDPAKLRPWNYVGAGLCIGVASLFKQPAFAAVALLPLASQDREGTLLKNTLWTLLGALLPWLAAWAFFAGQGAGIEFLQCTIGYNQGYVLQGLSGSLGRAYGLCRWLAPELGFLACLAALGWRSLGRDRASRAWLAAWLAVGLAELAASGRYYPHYGILLLPPLALLAALGLAGLYPKGLAAPAQRAPRALRGALAAVAVCGYAWSNGALWMKPSAADRTWHLYHTTTFVTAPEAAAHIQELSKPEERLFVWGDEAELYYLSQRRPATRFLFTYPLTGEAPPWPNADQEFMDGLMGSGTGVAVMSKGLDPAKPAQSRLFRALKEQYKADNTVPGFVIGGRKR